MVGTTTLLPQHPRASSGRARSCSARNTTGLKLRNEPSPLRADAGAPLHRRVARPAARDAGERVGDHAGVVAQEGEQVGDELVVGRPPPRRPAAGRPG